MTEPDLSGEDFIRVMCVPVKLMNPEVKYDVTAIRECTFCTDPVIVSAQGIAVAFANPAVTFVCLSCGIANTRPDQEVRAAPGSLQAVVDHGGAESMQEAELRFTTMRDAIQGAAKTGQSQQLADVLDHLSRRERRAAQRRMKGSSDG